ncbi:hypothetical protein CB1_000602024 [Camelus ferus]|nr:hypothetical protein CB1_000602024 [Camelus ferus]
MQQSDLFKAEYVFIVDSEGEDEAPSRQGEQGPPVGVDTTAARPRSLALSSSLASDVVRPKTRGADLQAPPHPEMPHGVAPQQKHGQLLLTSRCCTDVTFKHSVSSCHLLVLEDSHWGTTTQVYWTKRLISS